MRRGEAHLIDGDPLAAIRTELVAAAQRRLAARRRRRHMAALAASVTGLLTVTGVALALTHTQTGVPAIDRFLDVVSERSDQPAAGRLGEGDAQLAPGANPPPAPDVRPVDGSVSSPLAVPLGDGRRGLAVGYQSREGSICAALADPDAVSEAPPGFVSCAGASLLADTLKGSAARTVGTRALNSSTAMIQGFAREDVRSLAVIGPSGRVEAALSETWTPGDWQGGPLRVFFALIDTRTAGQEEPRSLVGAPIEVRLADGRAVQVVP